MKTLLLALCCLFLCLPAPAAAAAAAPLQLTGEVVYLNLEGGFYGIAGDDGTKYQPTNLPRSLRKPGLAIQFTALKRENTFSTFMWGTIVEIKAAKEIKPPLTRPERAALAVLAERMAAFNTKDLKRLQQVDAIAKGLTAEQFTEWLGPHHSFVLRYIDISFSDAYTISGSCIYTREGGQDSGQITQLRFTLERGKDGWKLAKSASEPCAYTPAEVAEDAKAKYGTDNLAKLWK